VSVVFGPARGLLPRALGSRRLREHTA
jgi:hypothetical protein